MVSIAALWLPVLVSAVIVFIVSSIIHTVLTYHFSDFPGLDAEDEVRGALRPFNLQPGDYVIPFAGSTKAMNSPEFIEKCEQGPNAFVTVIKSGAPSMTTALVQWFIMCLGVGIFAAYLAGRALEPGAHYLEVFRFVGASAFGAYAIAQFQDSIWYKRKWSTTFKNVFDGLVYALITAGVFGWLWPAT